MEAPPFLAACRREPVPFTPIWLMRQAGRYMPEYRAVREKLGFLELCKSPDTAAEVTVTAAERLGVDAAIIFADILLVLEPMGVGLEFTRGDGPAIARPVRTAADVDRLREVDVAELGFVFEAVRRARGALRVPLIGFAGAPFTVASYMIEGRPTKEFGRCKGLMYADPATWHRLMETLTEVTVRYLRAQVAAGAQALQLFDSWVGALGRLEYEEYVLPYSRRIFEALGDTGVPTIHFGTSTAALLEQMASAGSDIMSVDWRVPLDEAWSRIGHDQGIQGNLDPTVMLAPFEVVEREARRVLERAGGRDGHVFNLGHGVLADTPSERLTRLVDLVHQVSERAA